MQRIACLALVALASAAPATAQNRNLESLTEGGRYALLELNDQVVRLDTDTGVFSLCRPEADAWSCTLTIDERQVLEDQIAALTRRVEALERLDADTLAALQLPQPAPGPEPQAARVPAAPLAQAPGASPPAANDLPPLAPPKTVADQPVPLKSMASADKPERKGWLRRAVGLLPFVD